MIALGVNFVSSMMTRWWYPFSLRRELSRGLSIPPRGGLSVQCGGVYLKRLCLICAPVISCDALSPLPDLIPPAKNFLLKADQVNSFMCWSAILFPLGMGGDPEHLVRRAAAGKPRAFAEWLLPPTWEPQATEPVEMQGEGEQGLLKPQDFTFIAFISPSSPL